MMARIRSLAATPGCSFPDTSMARVRGFFCSRHCVANTWPTSVVPIPKARAPRAPWVLVWLSPHTMVWPGWLKPSSGPMTCTMPRCACCMASSSTPNSAQFFSSAATWRAAGVHRDRSSAEHLGRLRRGRMVHGGERAPGPAQLQPPRAQHLEGLRGGHLVDEVQIHVQDRRPRGIPTARTSWLCQSFSETACVALRSSALHGVSGRAQPSSRKPRRRGAAMST